MINYNQLMKDPPEKYCSQYSWVTWNVWDAGDLQHL